MGQGGEVTRARLDHGLHRIWGSVECIGLELGGVCGKGNMKGKLIRICTVTLLQTELRTLRSPQKTDGLIKELNAKKEEIASLKKQLRNANLNNA